MENRKVTIIMATYNRAHFIVETLHSIQKQTFVNWECLIIDDGGTDNTQEVIATLLEKDDRFKFFKRSATYQKGLPGCRNHGLDIANGDYIVFFDDDDIVHPLLLELCVNELQNPEVYFCRYLRTVFRDDFHYQFDLSKEYSKFSITSKDVDAMLTHKLPFNSCAVVWNKSCFESNRFVESLMYAEEWELYSRILSTGFQGVSIDKILFYGRKHPNSNTGEFFNNNPVRKKSKADAIELVVKNLKEKNMLSERLFLYMTNTSTKFAEYNLFQRIITISGFSSSKKIYYRMIYLKISIKKKIKNILR